MLSSENVNNLSCDNIKFSNIIQKVLVYCDRLNSAFEYKSGTTTINTTAETALKQGCGVCQDYAQILIGLCQKNDIPARYVAGFMIGEGVTHAWVEIYASGQWIGIDPTHNRMTDEKYIKVSDGRDAFDCIIDRGIFFGETRQNQEILVHVEEV